MIKPILWRCGFEVANVKRAMAKRSSQTVWYFAFGGNLDPATLKRRKIQPLATEPFVLRDYKLEFSRPGPFKGMGFASLTEMRGAIVVGKLLQLTAEDALRLDFYELVPVLRHYRRINVSQDGRRFFFYQTTKRRSGLQPTEGYKRMLLNGYKDMPEVDQGFLKSIDSIPALTDLTPSDELEFVFKRYPWASDQINAALARADRACLQAFMKYLLNRSITEQWIHV